MSPYPLPPTPQSTPRNSSSSSAIATMANGPRFSANSNLMNYSIPKAAEQQQPAKPVVQGDTESSKREVRRGNSSTRTRQLESQIEALTLQNVKLQRTNRLLKIDTDNLIKQKTQPLEQTIRELTFANVQLQRATRLLQQDLEEKTAVMEQYKQEQITKMKSVGPEYEFLVQMVNLLHRQINGDPTCEETCCYTLEPVSQSNMIMTLPPENEQQEMEAQHICRPVIHSSISQGSYAIELENKILQLEQVIEEMDAEKEHLAKQLQYKDNDIETLKRELRIKDDIVSQLESDFLHLEDQLENMQKELDNNRRSITHEERVQDPKRQSQLLMATKRRSLAIKDANALELMLRGDLQFNERDQKMQQQQQQQQQSSTRDDQADKEQEKLEPKEHHDDDHEEEEEAMDDNNGFESRKDTNITTPPRVFTPPSPPATPEKLTRRRVHSFLSCGVLPCSYPTQPKCMPLENTQRDPFAPFTLMTIFLGLAAQMGVTDDWTLPITLAVLVSGFLWSGAAKGVQFKLKLN